MERFIETAPLHTSSSSNFQLGSFQVPDQTSSLAVSMNEHGSKPLAISPSRPNKHPGFQSSACWEDFPSPLCAGHPGCAGAHALPTDLSPQALTEGSLMNSPMAIITLKNSCRHARILQICAENGHSMTQTLGCFLSFILVVPRQRPCLPTPFTFLHHGVLCRSGRDKCTSLSW